MFKLPFEKDLIQKNCMLISIAHAISVSNDPFLSFEHSWDGANYSTQDGEGLYGTFSFVDDEIVVAFRNENSDRFYEELDALTFFEEAPRKIVKIAEQETLQYLMDEVDGVNTPCITTAFWSDGVNLFSKDNLEGIKKQSGGLFRKYTFEFNELIEFLTWYYDFSDAQKELLIELYLLKVNNDQENICLTKKQIDLLGANEEGLSESQKLFKQLGIEWMHN